jgi:DNA polymerase-1
LKSLSQELDKDIKTLEATILRLQAKIQFSFSKQLGDILFEKLKLGPKQRKRRPVNMQPKNESYLAKTAK